MIGRGSTRKTALASCAAAVLACAAAPAFAQTAPPPSDPAELDPSAPLAPMPDLGVPWPDMNAPGEVQPPEGAAGAKAVQAQPTDETGEHRYTIAIEGLNVVGDVEEILKAFRAQSALEADRKRPANAAQIARRSRADADLLEELLRSQGYYDADVEPDTEAQGDMLRVVLDVAPGQQYRFASVELPGLDAAGPEAAKLRDTFAVKAGDPVIAGDVIAGGVALKVALGEQGYASATIGEQQVEVDHRTHLATLILPVDPGPVARFGAIRVSGEPPFSARHVAAIARFKPASRSSGRRSTTCAAG